MSGQEKKRQKIYYLQNTEITPNFLCQMYYKAKKKCFTDKKELFKEMGKWRTEQKMKRRLFNYSPNGD